MEAVSKSNSATSRAEYVQFTDLSTEAEKQNGTYKVQIKLLKQSDDIMIRPVCLLIPKVESVTPAFTPSGYDQDSIIKITFNKAVDPQSFGSYECLSLYSDSGDHKSYFDTPYFSSDNTVLNIPPKQNVHILTPDSNQKLDISVSLDYTNLKDKDGLSITQANVHTYRINDSFGNQETATIMVRTVEGTGRFVSDEKKICTIGYGFELQFEVNASDYKFTGLQALSKDGKESRSGYVTFEETARDEESGVYTIFVRAAKPGDDIVIQPVCLLLPKIISVTPESGSLSYASTPIVITFNMAMEEDTISKVKIQYSNKNISEYFNTPVFNQERTVLTIKPKPIELMSLMENAAYIDIYLRLGSDITITDNQTILPLSQNKFSDYSIRYRQATENTPPEKRKLFGFKNPTDLSNINLLDPYIINSGKIEEENLTKELVFAHRITNTVWIYGEYYDSESGLSSVTIKELRTHTSNGDAINRGNQNKWDSEKTYTVSDMEINYYGQGYASFCIQYDFINEDGLIELCVETTDLCNNHDKGEVITFVKNTKNPLTEVMPYNYYLEKSQAMHADFNQNNYEKELKTVKILDETYCTNANYKSAKMTLSKLQLYRNYYLEPQDFELWCNYESSDGLTDQKMTYDEEEHKWYINLNVQTVTALPIIISYKESNGIIWNNNYRFGGIPVIAGIDSVQSTYSTYKVYSPTEFTTAFSVFEKDNKIKYFHYIYNYAIYCILENNNLYGELSPVKPEDFSRDESLPDIIITDYHYENSLDNSGKTQIIAEIDESVWNTYESIFCTCTNILKSNIIRVEKNASYVSYAVNTKDIWNTVPQLKFWGITFDGVSSKETLKILSKLSTYGNEYDNIPPSYYIYDDFTRNKLKDKIGIPYYFDYQCLILCSDYESGIKDFKLELQDLKKNKLDCVQISGNYYSFPFYDMGDNPFFTGVATDMNDNQTYIEFARPNKYSIPEFTAQKSGENYIFIAKTDNEIGIKSGEYLYIEPIKYVYESEQTEYKWESCLSNPSDASSHRINIPTNITPDNEGLYIYTSSDFNLQEDTFIRINAYVVGNSPPSTYFYPADATYYYTGTPSSGEGIDYLFDNKKMILIASDQPVFVHTLVSKRDYTECVAWNEKQWEHNRRHINDTQLNFSPDNRSPQFYNVDTSSIDSGDCYVVIAHFANGTTAMSEVMQK